ncbi:BZ3500_MvSof-1268-A1-R1_Chr2-2g04740 [Microbotryum saponariae]|uniref:BZ3500_MvSof-1268-A1-R1_Chr2-2g04740 protein n=1 Tax=Microbotryum saponariae TaxID=289078 RepID=A0A2X0M6R7_9BASI|nr:BZ3500_MvSof-1268-A1-R1_Chr2-2g04740 [Microbotryum saponariae]SDA00047.1 BZ3501_MvSof-1269-A2-R1_Chr2-2g04414 [Microbotryum saponariae]
MLFKSLVTLALAAGSFAQRPTNTSICDYYTTALLKNNTGANQLTLLTLLVNTAVIGNYSSTPGLGPRIIAHSAGRLASRSLSTPLNVGVGVPGILNPNGTYNGTAVNLVPYFSGALASTNRGGNSGVSVNFLDGGGAAPLMNNTAANSNSTNQYKLLNHLYEFFGVLLGCTQLGSTYQPYPGNKSMYEVHKFMVLDPSEMNYFITQVALSAASFGVAEADIEAAGSALNTLFNYRCSPPVRQNVSAALAGTLQSICTESTCPLDADSNCTAQTAIADPVAANSTNNGSASATSAMGSATGSRTGSATAAAATTTKAASGANQVKAAGAVGIIGAAVALLL